MTMAARDNSRKVTNQFSDHNLCGRWVKYLEVYIFHKDKLDRVELLSATYFDSKEVS
jgi:hypothetical protein